MEPRICGDGGPPPRPAIPSPGGTGHGTILPAGQPGGDSEPVPGQQQHKAGSGRARQIAGQLCDRAANFASCTFSRLIYMYYTYYVIIRMRSIID